MPIFVAILVIPITFIWLSFIQLCDFFSWVFMAGLFFQFLIFSHFFTFRHFNLRTNANFSACFYPILCFLGTHSFPFIAIVIGVINNGDHFYFFLIRPILFGFLKLLFGTIDFFAHLYLFLSSGYHVL